MEMNVANMRNDAHALLELANSLRNWIEIQPPGSMFHPGGGDVRDSAAYKEGSKLLGEFSFDETALRREAGERRKGKTIPANLVGVYGREDTRLLFNTAAGRVALCFCHKEARYISDAILYRLNAVGATGERYSQSEIDSGRLAGKEYRKGFQSV
jgi:hypothetical protein